MSKLDNKNLMVFAENAMHVFGIYSDDFTEAEILDIGIRLERRYQMAMAESERDARELKNRVD